MALRFGNCLLADNVYVDRDTNKVVVAGMYSGDIRMGALPSSINVSFYLECWIADSAEHEVDVKILLNGDQLGGVVIKIRSADPETPAVLASPVIHMSIQKEGALELRATADGGKSKRLLFKKIQHGIVPT